MPDERIRKFVNTFSEAQECIDEKDFGKAKERYFKLLEQYESIRDSSLGNDSKSLAYDSVMRIRQQMSRSSIKIPLALACIIVVFGLILMMKPATIGFAVLPDRIVQESGLSIDKSGFYNVTLQGIPKSLNIRGTWEGEKVRLYLVKGKVLLRLFDSDKTPEGQFSSTCIDTCVLTEMDSNKITLLAEVANATLDISFLDYKARPVPNQAPEWKGPTAFPVQSTLKVNLGQYVSDADGDHITYLSTTDEDIRVTVLGDVLTVNPLDVINGTRRITILASDLKDVTRVPLVLAFT